MVKEGEEFEVTEYWNGINQGVCVKVVELYCVDEDMFVAFKNNSTSMEVDILESVVVDAIGSGVLVKLDSPEEIQM